MEHEDHDMDSLVRNRLRALRVAQGLSLEDLAKRANLSQSSLSRIENGQRRLALDQLVVLGRALGTSLDQLVESAPAAVVSNPMTFGSQDVRRWLIQAQPGTTVIRRRLTQPAPTGTDRLRAHPGREWFVVLSGAAILVLGSDRIRVQTHQAAEFPTMLPHAVGADGRPCDILGIFDRDAHQGHRDDVGTGE